MVLIKYIHFTNVEQTKNLWQKKKCICYPISLVDPVGIALRRAKKTVCLRLTLNTVRAGAELRP